MEYGKKHITWEVRSDIGNFHVIPQKTEHGFAGQLAIDYDRRNSVLFDDLNKLFGEKPWQYKKLSEEPISDEGLNRMIVERRDGSALDKGEWQGAVSDALGGYVSFDMHESDFPGAKVTVRNCVSTQFCHAVS